MKSLFSADDHHEILQRLAALRAGAARHWGKMDPAQALAHCTAAMSVPVGDTPGRQRLLGKLVTPFIRSLVLGPKPFSHNAPTDPSFIVSDARDFVRERDRLVESVNRLAGRGPGKAEGAVHTFFGPLSGDQWGILVYKHLDHHLRQFGG
jgi:hypothetical protein